MHSVKPNKFKLLLSLVALLLIFMVGVGVTYSWIEGGTTYSIQTEHEDDVKTGAHDSSFENTTIRLSTSATDTSIFQFNVFDNITKDYQDLIYTPVSSADGENFFLPVYDASGAQIGYRPATTNDIGNKYIQYETKFHAEDKCYISFNGITGLNFGTNKSNTDPSAFRMMLSDGVKTYIFAYNQTSATSKPVTSVTGITPTTTTVTTDDYNNYAHDTTDTSKRLFTFEKGETKTIKISVWLENTHEYSDGKTIADLYGNQSVNVRVPFIVDVPKIVFSLDAVTYDEDGNPITNGFTGGTIKYGSSTYSTTASNLSFVEGEGFTATANKKDGYEFLGWYSDADCNTQVTSSTTLSRNPDTSGKTYYALFQKLGIQTTTIYVEPRSGFSTYSIWAYQKFVSDTHHYSGNTWPGESAVLDNATGYYKYEFTTTDTGQFSVIISNNGGSQYPAQNEEGLVGDLGGTYLFTADNTLIEFDPADMITLNVSSLTGGSATVNNTSSAIVRPGKTVDIKATPSSGYNFVGWYKDAACTTTIGSNYATASQTITLTSADAGKTLNYYAKFEKIPTLTLNTSVTPTGGGTATAAGATSSTVQVGSTVSLKATASSGYRFVGWYTNSACTTTTGITNPTSASSAKYTVSGTDGSTVTLYAKFIKTYTVSAVAGTGGTATVDKTTVDTGGSAKFTATANSGYEFVGWYTASTGGTQKSTNNPYTLTNITSNTTLYARFEQTDITIYFTNNYSWSGTIYCHYWGGSSESTWPGVAMTSVGTNGYGQTQYKVTIPADTTGIIFDNGSGDDKVQTVNITTDIVNGKGFYISGGSGKNYTVTSFDY